MHNNNTELILNLCDPHYEIHKKSRSNKKNTDNIPAFLVKTFDILESNLYQDVVRWSGDGTAFIVKKVNDFSENVLPQYFKHNNFASFVRQLNMYDFHKTRNENNENEFKHRLFQRGSRSLLQQIKRKSGDQVMNEMSHQQMVKHNDRPYTELNELVTEMAILSNKQNELEKLIKIIIKQNEKFQKENKYLWNELLKNKDKSESQQDRVLLWLLKSIPQNQNNTSQRKNKTVSNSMLMIKPTDEEPENEAPQESVENIFQKIINETAHANNEPSAETLDSTLEGLSKKQLLQGLLQAFSFQRPSQSKQKSNYMLYKNFEGQIQEDENENEDNEINLSELGLIRRPNDNGEYADFGKPKKRTKREPQTLQKSSIPMEQRLMVYQEPKNPMKYISNKVEKKEIKSEKIEEQYDPFPHDFQQSKPQSVINKDQNFLLDQFSNDFIREDFIGDYLSRKDSYNALLGEQNINMETEY